MDDQDFESMADEHSGAGQEGGFIHVEVDKDLSLDIDQITILALLSGDHTKVLLSQPLCAVFVQWYALAAFLVAAPDQGALLDQAIDAKAYLGHVLCDRHEGVEEILTELTRWFEVGWAEDTEDGDAAT